MLMEMRRNPKYDVIDPNFRRLSYIRYADDFVVLIYGTRNEVEKIRAEIQSFLEQACGLELNVDKTLITYLSSEWFDF